MKFSEPVPPREQNEWRIRLYVSGVVIGSSVLARGNWGCFAPQFLVEPNFIDHYLGQPPQDRGFPVACRRA
jgi:hypothetical protein